MCGKRSDIRSKQNCLRKGGENEEAASERGRKSGEEKLKINKTKHFVQ